MATADKRQKKEATPQSPEEEVAQLLSQYLRQTPEGRKLVKNLKRDRTQGAAALNDYLRQKLTDDSDLADQLLTRIAQPEQQTTFVDSKIDQIINIKDLDELIVNSTRQFILFRNLTQLITFILLPAVIGISLGGLWYYWRWQARQPVPGPPGTFNIAIATFGAVTDKGVVETEETLRFTTILCNYLDSETEANLFGMKVHVDHKNMPIITERAEAAALAEKVNADLVVFGNVTFGEETGTFLPRFYVSGRNHDVEVSGYDQLSRPIRFTRNVDGDETFDEVLRTRAAIFTNYVKGLVYLNVRKRNLEGAEYSFQKAVTAMERQGEEFEGREVLYLMLSYTQKLKGDKVNYDKAMANLEKALAINPQYARAYIGLGNVHYQQYIGGDTDPILLDQAWDEYQMALDFQENTLGTYAYVDIKAMLGFANIQVMRARATGDPSLKEFALEDAIQRYEWVINRYTQQKDDLGLTRLVAYAYAGLGVAYEDQRNVTAARAAYEECRKLETDTAKLDSCQNALKRIEGRG